MTDSDDSTTLLGGRYELEGLLGRGGMADVRIGRDLRLGRTVAVKQLKSELAADPTFQERFRREAQSSAALNHPSIVAVYDTGEAPDAAGTSIPYIVMELVEGQTLREVLRDGRKILPERALSITADVLSALDYSHRAGIIHRDIKPANVMLTPEGKVKVMDFGIARAIADASSAMTQTAAVIGTAQYLSPEQARGETVDARSDIYSAGCLLYELLAGRPPFVGESPVSVAYQHVREEARPPSQYNPDVTASIDHIVAKSLAKRTEDRYQSAGDMRRDIERVIGGQHVDAPTTAVAAVGATAVAPAVAPVAGGARRAVPEPGETDRRKWWALGAVVLLALLGIGIAVWQLTGNDEPPVAQVEVPSVSELDVAAATRALEAEGFAVAPETETQASADVPVDLVIGTDPPAGDTVDEGSEITLIVSEGPEPVVLPDLEDLTYDQAAAQLDSRGLLPVRVERDSEKERDTVINTNPPAGTRVPPGTEVEVLVSRGQVEMPNVENQQLNDARATLEGLGLTVQVQPDAGSDQPPNTVTGQSIPSGQRIPPGTTVVLNVATEPTPTPTPTPTPPEEP
ncbi:kinase domain protein [Aeromicrobium marinum DSM 15272]|uniref:non-specific serine/threonine protein kinase n=1 Tax=Aeromicrobium marinum DSM 15272 TaxID=585531 RepID=E2S8T8_9ACTN|nr:Stk1 family PASTA domain-containing Ser/Thr kinase [Aeromicrobium marinum]EFQ84593.1 kinase domain protein [Aeromicrobium marinum DSM 15272]